MNKLDKIAEEYAQNKSSSLVFKDQHIKDFKAGVKESINLVDWIKVKRNLAQKSFGESMCKETKYNILNFFKEQIENQIKEL